METREWRRGNGDEGMETREWRRGNGDEGIKMIVINLVVIVFQFVIFN
jgi:hypothetical protein